MEKNKNDIIIEEEKDKNIDNADYIDIDIREAIMLLLAIALFILVIIK